MHAIDLSMHTCIHTVYLSTQNRVFTFAFIYLTHALFIDLFVNELTVTVLNNNSLCVLISGKTGVSQVMNAKQMCLVVFLLIVLYFKDKNLSNSIANLAQRPHILPSHETPIERGFGMT